MSLTIILTILCCLLFISTLFLGWKLYEFSIVLINIEDALEESLDILDEKYGVMNEILQKPIFFDSVEIRQVVSEIADCHRALLVIANKLTRQAGIEGGEKENKED